MGKMSKLLLGKEVKESINSVVLDKIEELKKQGKCAKLVTVRVGEKKDDISYEKMIIKQCEKLGLDVENVVINESDAENILLNKIETLNNDKNVNGILLFRPLSDSELEKTACINIAKEKDIDSVLFSYIYEDILKDNNKNVFTNDDLNIGNSVDEKIMFYPCTAEAVMEILDYYKVPLENAKVTVIGRSDVIGKPVAKLLSDRDAKVTICYSKTKNIEDYCKEADVIVVAVGRANFLKKNMVSGNQIVIDVGVNVNSEGKMVGDVDFEEVKDNVKAITPVPGGVGGVTSAILCKHVVKSCIEQL